MHRVILLLTSRGEGSRWTLVMEELVDLDESMQIDDSYLIESVLENLPNEDVDIDLTSNSDTEGTSTPTPHFRDDPLIPVYSSGKNRPYTTKMLQRKLSTVSAPISYLPLFRTSQTKTLRSWSEPSISGIGKTYLVTTWVPGGTTVQNLSITFSRKNIHGK